MKELSSRMSILFYIENLYVEIHPMTDIHFYKSVWTSTRRLLTIKIMGIVRYRRYCVFSRKMKRSSFLDKRDSRDLQTRADVCGGSSFWACIAISHPSDDEICQSLLCDR